jgi:hypothetical protein
VEKWPPYPSWSAHPASRSASLPVDGGGPCCPSPLAARPASPQRLRGQGRPKAVAVAMRSSLEAGGVAGSASGRERRDEHAGGAPQESRARAAFSAAPWRPVLKLQGLRDLLPRHFYRLWRLAGAQFPAAAVYALPTARTIRPPDRAAAAGNDPGRLTMESSASAGRVASAVLDPRRWQRFALLTTASMNSARVFLAAWSRSQTRAVVPGRRWPPCSPGPRSWRCASPASTHARCPWHGACGSLGMKKIINVIVGFLNTLVGNTDEARRIDGQRADVDNRRR